MMPLLRTLILMLFFTGNVVAAEQAFTQAEFDRLQQIGEPILVVVHADWCPTCRAQAPVLQKLLEQDAFKSIHALRVDFDQQRDIVQAFKVIKQSTLIVFKDGKEIDRSLGVTSAQGIEDLLRKAL